MNKALGLKVASIFTAVVGLGLTSLPSVDTAGFRLIDNAALAQTPAAPKLAGCKAQPEKRRLKALDQKFFKKVAEVDALISPEPDAKTGKAPEPNYKAAWPKIKQLVDRCDDCNDYEWAQLYQRAAVVQYNLDNVPGAIDYFKKVLSKSPNIPDTLETQLTYQIAQLLTSEERYKEALDYFGKWEALCPTVVPDDYFYFRAQNLYLLNRKDEALAELNKSIKLAQDKGEKPREGWFKLQLAIFIDKEDYKSAEKVAEQLATLYTDTRILTQLASIYGMNGKEKEQMALMDALYVTGALDKENQYKNLAYLFLGAEAPYLASKVMKKGIDSKVITRDAKNLEVWAVSLTQAQELKDALPIMEEAAQKMDNGKIYATLAAIYLNTDKFDEAVAAARKALNKGGLRSQGEVHMYMGSAYLSLKKYDESIKALKEAVKDDKYKTHAQNLMKYVQNEKAREEGLRNANLDA